MKTLYSFLALILLSSLSYAQLTEEWNEAYGGASSETANGVIETPDGGYILVGSTSSEGSGKLDGYILKINHKGEQQWTETYGGAKDDEFYSITAIDGNYAIGGYTESKGGGEKDFWLMVIDQEGKKIWEYFYGGEKDEEAFDIITSFDNKLILSGYTKTKGAGGRDFWVVKVNPSGEGKALGQIIWAKTVGGKGADFSTRLKQNPLDSFIYVLGHSNSSGEGGLDVYFTKLDPERGTPRAKVMFGKVNFEHGNDFCFVDTSGYLLVGGTLSETKGLFDGWCIFIENEYYKVWEKTFGGSTDDEIMSVVDNGKDFILAGSTSSQGEGKSDAWVVQYNRKGQLVKETTYGEEGNEKISKIIACKNGGYMLVGSTDSKGNGKTDLWAVKIK
jgi:hypothetical protein